MHVNLQRRRPRRLIAGVLAGALAISVSPLMGVSPAGAADQLPPVADPTADGAFCEGRSAANPFSDLGGESAATREVILCLVETGLTQGKTPTTFEPGALVTRRQMAIFITRFAEMINDLETNGFDLEELPAYDGTPDFNDLGAESAEARAAIGRLSQAGVVGGFPDDSFRPGDPVSRRQMAAFVNRLQDFLTGQPYPQSGDYFDDDNGDPGEPDLDALAGVGIFQGDGNGNVNPGGVLTRRQMANILLRDAQVYYAFGAILGAFQPAGNETLTFTPDTAVTVQALNDTGANQAGDDRLYTASNLPASAGGYRITLVQCSLITNTGGDVVFTEDANTGLASAGTSSAQIIQVNGAAPVPANLGPGGQSVGAVQPAGGTITVAVDATTAGCVIPVIYTDQGGANTRLNLGNDNRPTEPFGIGGSFTVTAAASNATLAITPTDATTLELATEPSTADDRQYSVTGLTNGVSYRVQLIPAANVQGTSQFTFTEVGATNTADFGAVGADITVANGAVVPGSVATVTVQPVNGQITFTVDGNTDETVVPIIFRDADAGGDLDLNADNTPVATEPFGVGGSIRYIPVEATLGAHNAIVVSGISPDRQSFTAGGATYFLDGNDIFQYQAVGITQAQFDSMLSVGDTLNVSYNPDPAGTSVFNITADDVDAPAAPTVTVVNSDAGPSANDARITYTRPATNSPGVTYTLQRTGVLPGADLTCGTGDDIGPVLVTFTNVAGATQAAGTGSGVFVFSDNNAADGCYSYRVVATSPVSNVAAPSNPSNPATVVPTPADVTAPQAVFTARTTDTSSLDLDGTDVVKVVFNEPMAAPTALSSVTITDGNGTIATLTNSSNAAFTLNAAPELVNAVMRPVGTVLTITLTGAPNITVAGANPGIQLPAIITNRVAITDSAGNGWNLAAGDVTIND